MDDSGASVVIPRLFDAGGGDVGISVLDAAGHKLGERHLALLNIVVFHAAGNTWSDYFDYKHKSMQGIPLAPRPFDRRDVASARDIWLVDGIAGSCLVAGVGLLWRTGLPLLYIGIAARLARCFIRRSSIVRWAMSSSFWRMLAADVGYLLCGYGSS